MLDSYNGYKAAVPRNLMHTRIKKLRDGQVYRTEASGDIKEVLIHSNMIQPEKAKISICFKGNNSSGIIELTESEANELYKTLSSKIGLIKDIRIIRSKE